MKQNGCLGARLREKGEPIIGLFTPPMMIDKNFARALDILPSNPVLMSKWQGPK